MKESTSNQELINIVTSRNVNIVTSRTAPQKPVQIGILKCVDMDQNAQTKQ